ncbi:Hypothetical predicted protein [Pelobates cultripes]|uniref:Uncharacterized protein n=1 Tax=Pelobates cultripes TaxID=61616 RepID=A0AAD1STV1_PELCU|nr:Hypothetical predicted protein [Pelobates cultripes]
MASPVAEQKKGQDLQGTSHKSKHPPRSTKSELPVTSESPVTSFLKHRIIIFSRCQESYYQWLRNKLKDKEFGNLVDEVCAVNITNIYSEFIKEIPKCTFAILYHTTKFGRVNITNVTDALYDKELQDLSHHLGKDKVIVVIDDMKVTSTKEKDRILKSQPSIGTLTKELFLFDENKNNLSKQVTCLKTILGEKLIANTEALL